MNLITEIWEQLSDEYGSRIALKDEITGYSLSFMELHQNINKTIKILNNFDISKEDKVVLFVRPHPLWHVIDQAIMKSNSISVPCESTSNFEEIIHIVKKTKSKYIFTSNFNFIEQFIKNDYLLEKRFIFYIGVENIDCFKNKKIEVYNFIELIKNTDINGQENYNIQNPNNIATIVFSSGTTGEPKGTVITHENLFLAFSDHKKIYGNVSEKKCINIHCCSHIAPRIIELVFLSGGNTIIYTNYINFLKTVKKYKAEYLLCVPKLVTNISEEYKKEVSQKSKLFQKFHSFFFYTSSWYFMLKNKKESVVSKTISYFLYVFYRIYSKYFRNNILNDFINNNATILVFGNLVAKNTELFFKIMDINLLIIYGATEVVTYISYSSTKYDVINKLNPKLIVEIRDLKTNKKLDFNQTGLIKIKGKQVMKQYYENEQKTRDVFDDEGYYTTGDLGYISKDFCLYFKGREKNIIALNNGEKVNPVKIEEICKKSFFIDQIVVFGQEKPYLTALVIPNMKYLNQVAKKKNITSSNNNFVYLLKKEILIDINNLIGEDKFFRWIEQIKDISFIYEPFTIENGMLTNKYTVIRKKVYDYYKDLIEAMYR